MPRKRYSTEQIVTKLRQAEVELGRGLRTPQGCKKLGISEQTYSRWRKEYGGLRLDQAKRLKVLEQETLRLKKLEADHALDNAILKEVASGKLLSPPWRRQAVNHVRPRLSVSERRACRVMACPPQYGRVRKRPHFVTPPYRGALADWRETRRGW